MGMAQNYVLVGGTCQSKSYTSANTQGFEAEHFSVTRWLSLFTSPVSGSSMHSRLLSDQKQQYL